MYRELHIVSLTLCHFLSRIRLNEKEILACNFISNAAILSNCFLYLNEK